ncbi:MAG: ABC-2 family transporter protein [Gemmataceae bacterium]|nr:ABC-2 family transporter protein [Gemmataceae bacterium]
MNTQIAPASPVASTSRSVYRSLRKYFNIFRIALVERLAYRSDFILSSALRLLPMLTTILLWTSVYVGSGQSELSGFRLAEMIAYLLLVHISRMFSSMPGLANNIALDIREGNLKKYLLQPLDMLSYLIVYRVAHKIAYIVTSFVPYAILFFLCRHYFDHLPDVTTWVAYGVSLILAFFVGFYFEACIGMAGFWLLEVTSLLYIVNTLNYFVSGHMFPLDLLPEPWADLLKCLPFQYMAYFPAAVFLGKVEGEALWRGLLAEAGWAIVLVLTARGLFRLGLRRYSAFGG